MNFFREWKDKYFYFWCGGIFLYLQTALNLLANPDTVWNGLFYKSGYDWENNLGRWAHGALAWLRGYVFNPTLVTVFSLLMLSFIIMLICRMFDLKDPRHIVFAGIILLASPNVADTLSYYYCSDFYILAYLMNVAAVYLINKRDRRRDVFVAAGLIAGSLAIYQAYISVAIVLCLCLLLLMLLGGECKTRELLQKAIRFVSAGGGGVVIYLALTGILQKLCGFSLTDGRGFSQMGRIDILRLPGQIKSSYVQFAKYFLCDELINNSWLHKNILNGFIFGTLLSFILILYFENGLYRDKVKSVLTVVAIVLMPLGFMSMTIAAPDVSLYEATGILTIPAMNYVYILWLVLAGRLAGEKRPLRLCREGCALAGGVAVSWALILFAGAFQNCMQDNLMRTKELARQISYEVDRIPGKTEYVLMIGGSVPNGDQSLQNIVKGTVAAYGLIWDTNGRNYCWTEFFRQYCGKNYTMCTNEEYEKILLTPEYQNMPVYPDEGAVSVMDQCIVVKIGNE